MFCSISDLFISNPVFFSLIASQASISNCCAFQASPLPSFRRKCPHGVSQPDPFELIIQIVRRDHSAVGSSHRSVTLRGHLPPFSCKYLIPNAAGCTYSKRPIYNLVLTPRITPEILMVKPMGPNAIRRLRWVAYVQYRRTAIATRRQCYRLQHKEAGMPGRVSGKMPVSNSTSS